MRHKAQSIMEYVALLAIVSMALLSMQIYFKQGVQAGIRSFADHIGSQKKGSAEDDYGYVWFTQGVKGLKSISRIDSAENGETKTTMYPDNSVTYNRSDVSRQSGLAEWSVGIERERSSGGGGGT